MPDRGRLAWRAATLVAVAAVLSACATVAVSRASAVRVPRVSPSSPPSSSSPSSSSLPSPPASSSPSPSAPPSPGPASPYRVVGLGDSVPAGTACYCDSYVTQVARAAAGQRVPDVANLAQDGLTTSGLADQLDDSAVRDKLTGADLVIVTIGANDFDAGELTDDDCQPATELSCYQDALAQQRSELAAVLARIGGLHPAAVLVTGYWNVFLDGRVGRERGGTYVAGSNALTLADNAVISSVAAAQGDTYVDIYGPFKGDGSRDDTNLLASDGDHPNAAGHALIAQTLLHALP